MGNRTMSIRKVLATTAFLAIACAFGVQSTSATSSTGTVAVTATTVASVSLTFVTDVAGITLGGTGTSAATIAFGSVQAYGGSSSPQQSKTRKATTNSLLSTPLFVVLQCAHRNRSTHTRCTTHPIADST